MKPSRSASIQDIQKKAFAEFLLYLSKTADFHRDTFVELVSPYRSANSIAQSFPDFVSEAQAAPSVPTVADLC